MQEGARFFLTNDARLVAISDLEVLVLDALQNALLPRQLFFRTNGDHTSK